MGSIESAFVLEILKLDSVFTVMGYFPDASELLPNPNSVEADTDLVRRWKGNYELPGQVEEGFGHRRGLSVGASEAVRLRVLHHVAGCLQAAMDQPDEH